jgi:hypothetical protein
MPRVPSWLWIAVALFALWWLSSRRKATTGAQPDGSPQSSVAVDIGEIEIIRRS